MRLRAVLAALLFWPAMAVSQPPPPPPPPPPPLAACQPVETRYFFEFNRSNVTPEAMETLRFAASMAQRSGCPLVSVSVAGLGASAIRAILDAPEMQNLPAGTRQDSRAYRSRLIWDRTRATTNALMSVGIPQEKIRFSADADPSAAVRQSAGDIAAGWDGSRVPPPEAVAFDHEPIRRRVEVAFEFE